MYTNTKDSVLSKLHENIRENITVAHLELQDKGRKAQYFEQTVKFCDQRLIFNIILTSL